MQQLRFPAPPQSSEVEVNVMKDRLWWRTVCSPFLGRLNISMSLSMTCPAIWMDLLLDMCSFLQRKVSLLALNIVSSDTWSSPAFPPADLGWWTAAVQNTPETSSVIFLQQESNKPHFQIHQNISAGDDFISGSNI